jgi:hypothetical protein
MIDKDEIESKDFSSALPRLIGQLRFIGLGLAGYQYVDDLGAEDLNGAGWFLLGIAEDLNKISKALYHEQEDWERKSYLKAERDRDEALELLVKVLHRKPEARENLKHFMENLLKEDSQG